MVLIASSSHLSLSSSFFVIASNDIVDNVKAKISLDSFFFFIFLAWVDNFMARFDIVVYI